MQLQNSVAAFKNALFDEGHANYSVEAYVASLITHATMCRTRADLPPGAFRDFVTKASEMTRNERALLYIEYHNDLVVRAACEALHDLIMEGV